MNPTGERPRTADESTLAQSLQLLNLLRYAPTRNRLVLLAALIVAVIVLNAVAQVRLNSWQAAFTTRSPSAIWACSIGSWASSR